MAKSAHNKKSIGILGGTFNPVHRGHLNIASKVMKKLLLDEVVFVPAYIPPHKKIEDNIKPSDRLNMVRSAIKKRKRFSLSLYEIKKKKKSYSINTIKYFKNKFGPDKKLFFLIGADSLIGIRAWRHIKEALKLAGFVAVNRPGYSFRNCPSRIKKIRIKSLDVSSSKIRSFVKRGRPIRHLVPAGVCRYIKKKKLYALAPRGANTNNLKF